ncbi:hypothetical protein [Fructobacillus cardui]|jgi:hypothetical protein|uniref:Diacylglycerol kinase family (LCB5) n=1 Tax=Fructobacillus cardui TaxID=2893170 RepID=A0ABN9YNG4_9LACO|nr:Phosphatidylglycerol kinase [Fructobacillus cardui]CAK1230948.1 Phosphatidylglycerol kinase [Fructobacillus cardui]
MTSAHFIIDTTLIRQKDLGSLDQIQGQLTAAQVVTSFQKASTQNPVYNLARKVAKTLQTEEVLPIVVIGNPASLNATLAAILDFDESLRWPLLLINWGDKNHSTNHLVNQILTSLNNQAIQQAPLGLVTGSVPKQGKQYFLDSFQVGPDFSAILPKFNQKFAWKHAFHQMFSFWGQASRNQNKISFSWTLRFGHTYQNHSKTLGLQIILGQDGVAAEIRLVNQLPWPQIMLTYLRGKKGVENPSRKGFTTIPLTIPADFHIQDIQSVKIDGRLLQSGAYSFTMTIAGTYPIMAVTEN